MFKNYLKIAFRNFRRNAGYASINVVGLALGMACCLLALLFLRNEWSYDRFHDNAEDIYRVTARFNRTIQFSVVPDPLVPAAVDEFPEIINGTRIWESNAVIKQGAQVSEETATYIDPAFFDVFAFPMQRGSHNFSSNQDVILTPETAEKYFGNTDPVGQVLDIRLGEEFGVFKVIGVVESPPINSTITFDLLVPFDLRFGVKDAELRDDWSRYGVLGFIQLQPGADTSHVYSQLLSLVEKHHGESIREDGEAIEDYAYLISPFVDHHLGGGDMGGFGLTPGASPAYVYLLAIIAGLVLLIACFNFMNLSIGQASGRLKEIGVRKVIGAARKQLLFQFGIEALALSLLAGACSIAFVYGALPYFNDVAGVQLDFQLTTQPQIAGVFLTIILATTLFAGFYPALVLSGIQSIAAFRRKFRFGGANLFTQSLVVVQFACTILFLIGTMFISRQHTFMREANLGFEKEQLVLMPISSPPSQPETGERLLARFKEAVAGVPTIKSVAGTSDAFTMGNSATMKTLDDGRQVILYTYRIDDDFVASLDLELLAGRNFDPSVQSDALSGIIVNEAFAKEFGMEQPVGQVVPVDLVGIEQPMIIGLVKDFHFESLHRKVQPVFLHQRQPYKINFLLAKISPENVPASIAALRETWMTFRPDYPFEYQFLDEVIDAQYAAEERWSQATTYASWIAMFIACLGLLGLTSITMTRRTKEIGIRKVLGASVAGLVNLLSKEFVLLVAIANLIAWPLAYFAVNWWLEDFSYRIELGAGVFLIVGLLTICLALITISFQSIKTASSDPVKSLKYE